MNKISELLPLMNPEYAQTIEVMFTREGFTSDASVDDVLKILIPATMTHEEGIALLAFAGVRNNLGKFAPKLSFGQRCQALALRRLGFTREVLSKMFKVDRRTITHIYNESSPHYKNVREEEKLIGTPNFVTKYVTESIRNEALSYTESEKKEANNKAANRKAGTHNVRNDRCKYDHRVTIAWINANEHKYVEVSGWYYRDLDSQWPDDWFNCGAESMKTSQAAYDAAKEDIDDALS
jgi:hypothetical protein